MNLDKLNVRA